MPTHIRDNVRREVLRYLADHAPVRMSNLAEDLRTQHHDLKELRDADFRSVVQPMIATGKLSYAPGLKITIGKASK